MRAPHASVVGSLRRAAEVAVAAAAVTVVTVVMLVVVLAVLAMGVALGALLRVCYARKAETW